jgi:endonuclease-3 related protein
MNRRATLMSYFQAMHLALGDSGWWPAKTPFAVMLGAVLTQNTSWKGVAKAMANLEAEDLLDPAALRDLPVARLEELIRPAGYFRLKAKRLGNLLDYLDQACAFDLAALKARDMAELRQELLGVSGIGPETADSILLYALGQPSFVIDAYTRRILSRHGLVPADEPYEDLRDFFMDALDHDPALFNEFHALLVRVGHHFCKPGKPLCAICPLDSFPH